MTRSHIVPSVAVMATVLLASFWNTSCRSVQTNNSPSIQFTRLPRADDGGTESRAVIEGRADGARPGEQIVLFARSGAGLWWVQPFADQAYTKVQPDARWQNSTHLGTEYAALLVVPGYRPQTTLTSLPNRGGQVLAVAVAKGIGSPQVISRTLHFSGYEWEIRSLPSDRGGSTNTYDPSNAWTDVNGRLHLRIARGSGEWTCAEVVLTRSLGYGSYRFVVDDTSELDPAAVFGMFTWDDFGSEQNHRELDIEVSRWGDPASKNAQYVVQPYYVPANVVRFDVPAGVVTHTLRWEPGRAVFRTFNGSGADPGSTSTREHVFTSGVPLPGGETIRINLYAFDNKTNPLRSPAEVVIEKFEYLP